jgi:glycosyltransferase involved in cell wall biosynthesis
VNAVPNSYWAEGNAALRRKDYAQAIELYEKARVAAPALADFIKSNIELAKRRLQSQPQAQLSAKEPTSSIDKNVAMRVVASRHAQEVGVYQRHLTQLLKAIPDSAKWQSMLEGSEENLARALMGVAQFDQQPLVSVIMPTHNRASIIRDAIMSVLEQSYAKWELLVCDDASTDDTKEVVHGIGDRRVRYLGLSKGGAPAARNSGLRQARGEIIAYLDSDNYWHPEYLTRMTQALAEHSGCSSAYCAYIDYQIGETGKAKIREVAQNRFDHERLLAKNFIDLNSFVHRRELYDSFGGFDERLTRRQDYDLIIKYTWLRDPVQVPDILALYQRNATLGQITRVFRDDMSCVPIIEAKVQDYLSNGLPVRGDRPVKKVTIISWDLCRNHFSKPFALAEALSRDYQVQLISFRFFEEEIFPPLAGVKPEFETVYFQGRDFPEFFDTIKKALDAINGDVIYAVKPRMPSLGVALLANQLKGIPVILEINDLETVVGSPKQGDRHVETGLDSLDFGGKALLSPYSDLWSQVMDPLAKQTRTLVTHNKNLDRHFGGRCLYMRNLKDEAVYNPANYDRKTVRAELGFDEGDRVILFGGLLRKHKGIYELVELVERLADPRYKLLFVGSRPTPDQKQLIDKFGNQVRVLPPQDREAMARINLAADLVILWLNPDVPASHYQFPYKATDAFAMGPAIIANDISDLGDLALQGYLRQVPFGDWDQMALVVRELFDKLEETQNTRAAAQRLFLRQFSYAAARGNFELMARRVASYKAENLPAARDFAKHFNLFYRSLTGSSDDFLNIIEAPKLAYDTAPYGAMEEDSSIHIVDVKDSDRLSFHDPNAIAIVMPSIKIGRALATARLLIRRAGMKANLFIVEDTLRQGFIRTLNASAERMDAKYLVYLAEDAYPGQDWLEFAYSQLESSGKGLLGFNCGKWHGRIAAFGMVRKSWVKRLYDGAILYPGYINHRADNELTEIARATNQFVYGENAVLLEIDPVKVFRKSEDEAGNFHSEDRELFKSRRRKRFAGLLDIASE